jgi:hypothetical protein
LALSIGHIYGTNFSNHIIWEKEWQTQLTLLFTQEAVILPLSFLPFVTDFPCKIFKEKFE